MKSPTKIGFKLLIPIVHSKSAHTLCSPHIRVEWDKYCTLQLSAILNLVVTCSFVSDNLAVYQKMRGKALYILSHATTLMGTYVKYL